MARSNFETLQVYLLSEKLADAIWDIASPWRPLARDTVGQQLIRAADSIGANISEGCGRGSYQDNRRFVRIARGSLNETKHWLRRAYQRKLSAPAEIELIRPLVEELAPRLNAYLASIGRNESQSPHNQSRDGQATNN